MDEKYDYFGHLRLYESFYDNSGHLLVKTGGQTAESSSGRKALFLFDQTDKVRRSENLPRYYVKRRNR